jgi:hypothetical protein
MTYGPIDLLALEFKGNQFKGEIMPALVELVKNEIIRVIDLVIVRKDMDGKVTIREMQQFDPEYLSLFDPLKVQISGMIKGTDAEQIGEKLELNTTAAILLFENLWVVKFREAVLNANGRVVLQERLSSEYVMQHWRDQSSSRE